MGVPEEEQVIVEGMHQGIAMKVKCGTCGRTMTMKSGVVRGVDYQYFHCPHVTV